MRIRRHAGWVGIALVCLVGPTAARAGRPLDTEDTGTNEPGEVQLEVGASYARNPDNRSWALAGVLSLGVLPRLEVRAESAVLRLDPDDGAPRGGLGDSLLGVKYRVLDEAEAWPAVLAALTVRLPTGDEARGLGAPRTDVQLLVAAGKAWGPVTLTWNAAYTFVTDDRDLDVWTLAAAVEYRITARWTVVGELVGGLGAQKAADTLVARSGAVYALTERIHLDGAVAIGLTRESPDLLLTVGATLGF